MGSSALGLILATNEPNDVLLKRNVGLVFAPIKRVLAARSALVGRGLIPDPEIDHT
jgi:hypothetical protein